MKRFRFYELNIQEECHDMQKMITSESSNHSGGHPLGLFPPCESTSLTQGRHPTLEAARHGLRLLGSRSFGAPDFTADSLL